MTDATTKLGVLGLFVLIGVLGAIYVSITDSDFTIERYMTFYHPDTCWAEFVDDNGLHFGFRLWNVTVRGKGDCQRLQEKCGVNYTTFDCTWIDDENVCECY